MADDNTIRYEADISDLVAKTKTLLSLNDAQTAALLKYISTSQKYTDGLDAQGNAILGLATSIKAQISETQTLDATYRNTAKGVEILTAKLVTLSQAEVDEAKAAKDATAASRTFEQAARDRVKALNDVIKAEKQANDLAAKTAAIKNQQARVTVLDSAVRQGTQDERGRLQGYGSDISLAGQGKLLVLARDIGEVGAKAGLTTTQLREMFAQVNTGNFSAIESKYAEVVKAIQQYNNVIAEERSKAAKSIVQAGPGGGGALPSPSQAVLDNLSGYASILKRIQGTLINLTLYRGFNTIQQELTGSISAAREYQTQVGLIRTISQDAQLSTDQWTEGLKKVSNTLAIDFKDSAKAAYDAVSSQIVQGQSTFKYVEDIGQLARTTGSDIKDAGEAVSGVINSYKLTASDAAEISAKLFRTVDLGNVKLPELAGNIGRVTSLGNELGVTFDEVAATISVMTKNGVKTSDSMTFLTNVFTKLLAPTDKTKEALKSIGIESVSAAIKAQGFQNVIQKLIQSVQAGKVDVSELFPEIRGEKGFALLKQNFEEFGHYLDEIKTKSGEYYKNAQDIVSQTESDKINRTTTLLKNVLTNSIGDTANRLIAGFVGVQAAGEKDIDTVERLEKTVNILIRAFAGVATTVGTFTVAMKSAVIVTDIINLKKAYTAAAIARETAALAANTVATNTNNAAKGAAVRTTTGAAAFAGANPYVAVGITAISLIAGLEAARSQSLDAYSSVQAAYEDLLKRIQQKSLNKPLQDSVSTLVKMKDEFRDITKYLEGDIEKGLASNNDRLNKIRDTLHATQDDLKNAFVGSLDKAKNGLEIVKNKISDIDSSIKNAPKLSDKFREEQANSLLGTQLKYADPYQQLGLIEQRFNQTKDKITKLMSVGTAESYKEAEQLFNKLTELSTQYYEKEADQQKTQFEEGIKADAAQGIGDSGPHTFLYDSTNQLKTINQLQEFQNQLSAKGVSILQQRKDLLIEEKKTRQRDIAARTTRIQEFENFNVSDNQGKIKSEYLDEHGRFSKEKFIADYNKVIGGLKADIGPDILKQLDFDNKVKERLALLGEQAARIISGKGLESSQKNLGSAISTQSEAIDKGKAGLEKYNAEVLSSIAALEVFGKQAKETATNAPETLFSTNNKRQTRISTLKSELTEDFSRAKEEAENFLKLLEEIKKSGKVDTNGVLAFDPEKIKAAIDQAQIVKSQLYAAGSVGSERAGVKFDAESFSGPAGRAIGDASQGVDKALNDRNTSVQLIERAKNTIEILKTQQQVLVDTTKTQENALKSLIGGLGDVTQDQIKQLDLLSTKINNLNKGITGGAQGPTGEGDFKFGVYSFPVEGKAYGGPIYRAYGGPVGKDNIPIWASEGEYMINASATKRFYSQIASMNNQARTPQYFNKGGSVTNLGGVTFNVTDSQNPQQTARTVAQLLRRASRTGTI